MICIKRQLLQLPLSHRQNTTFTATPDHLPKHLSTATKKKINNQIIKAEPRNVIPLISNKNHLTHSSSTLNYRPRTADYIILSNIKIKRHLLKELFLFHLNPELEEKIETELISRNLKR